MEGREGANKYTYYVTKSPGPAASWAVLPHVTVAQLAAAQRVRRFLSHMFAPGHTKIIQSGTSRWMLMH